MDKNKLYTLSKEFLILKNEEFSKKEVIQLQKLLLEHSTLYYELDESIISDTEYDELLKKLEVLEKMFSLKTHTSHTVGSTGTQSSFKKVKHSRSMISLGNTYNAEDLNDFDTRIKRILSSDKSPSYMLEFKFDGLGIELVYEDGNLIQAITRGDGVQGEDVTENIKQIKNIPKHIDKPGRFEVRGEVVMPLSSFEKLNTEAKEKGEKIFSNPRNAASGSLRVLDTRITKKRDLRYFAYDVSDFEEFSAGTYSDMIHTLEELGFDISSYFMECNTVSEVIHSIEHIGDIKSQIDFEIDGLVIKVNDMSLWSKIGFTEHHPRYAIAYKFPAEIVTTKILSVQHSVGRTGTITPVANLEPVNIGGAIIRRATLHNYDETAKLGVAVGDMVFMKRAGEVIPKIISVSVSSGEDIIVPPSICPSCGENIFKDEEKVRYFCANSYECSSQMKEKFAFTVGKQGFNIDGFGEKQAELFLKMGYIKTYADIFRLKNFRENILELEGFKERSVNNLLEGIEKVRSTDVVTFLKALGIPGVGKKTAKTIGKYIENKVIESEEETLSGILSLPEEKETTEELKNLPDIGPEVAENVVAFFTEHQELVKDLLSEVHIEIEKIETKEIDSNNIYYGKKMCITGSFDGYKREELAEILEKRGGEFVGSVSKKTDFLLAGEKAGGKLKKANELGVEVVSLEEFIG